jgi:prophage antirepressor-like protein
LIFHGTMEYPPLNSTTSLGIMNHNISYNEGKAICINEPGLYTLIMQSNVPFAAEFQC